MRKPVPSWMLIVSLLVNGSIQCIVADNDDDSLSEEAFEERTQRAMAESCRSPDTTDEDIEAFINEDPEPSYETKCIEACVLKKFDIITQDGKFNVEGTKQLYELLANDDDELNRRYDVINSCASIADDDECELPSKIESCLLEKGEEVGIEDW